MKTDEGGEIMAIQRCPECGQRLKTNYCDICMRKVPFAGKRTKAVLDPWEYSSAHREEKGHQCVSFGDETPKKIVANFDVISMAY